MNIIRKLDPSVLLSSKWQIENLGDAGTIDRFGLAFQYQIKSDPLRTGRAQDFD